MIVYEITMGTHCAPLFAEVVLHAYKAYFIQWLPKIKKWKINPNFQFQLPL
jgi:hypothetical protein